MGRMLGAFDNSPELDRPDLNKCPDCECFFAGDNCPLCGKVCPEEMRAGNRKPPKKEKRRRSSSSGRVTFVEWYHSWWFIILAMFLMPVAGIILLITSPHEKSKKITFIVIGVAYLLLSSIGIGTVIGMVGDLFNPPVNTYLSREEYVERCTAISTEEFYRNAEANDGKYLCLELKIVGSFYDGETYYNSNEYQKWYICTDVTNSSYEILVADYLIKDKANFVTGDVIKIFGQGAGIDSVYDTDGRIYTAPVLFGAYVELQ